MNRQLKGHLLTFFTVMVWAVTFISTKVLLDSFSTVEIIFCRFIIAILFLFMVKPRLLKFTGFKHEILFAAAGIAGVSLYFLFETMALSYTQASNVSIIVSMAPVFTAIFVQLVFRSESLSIPFFIGFLISISGIVLVSLNGNYTLKLNPAGDILALLCAVVWGIYSVLIKKLNGYGYDLIQTTRRIFIYGLLFMIPAVFFFDVSSDFARFAVPSNILNLLFLGIVASGICFLSWNKAVELLGPVKTSVYIYLQPMLTIIFSVIVLNERITPVSIAGSVLITIGLVISEKFNR